MSKTKRLIVLLCVALCSQYVCAQTPEMRVLGLDEVYALAEDNSQSMRAYKTGVASARHAVKAAQAERLPNVDVSLSASFLGDGYLWDRHFGNGQNIPMPHFGNNFALEVQQVLYSGGAISSGIALAQLGEKMAELDVKRNRQDIRFLLTGYYLDLFKLDNQLQVLAKNLELTEQVIRRMQVRQEEGTVLKNDITRFELGREQIRLQMARVEDARSIVNHQLVTILHLPADTHIKPDCRQLDTEVIPMAEADWQQLRGSNHTGLQSAALAVKMNEQKVKLERSALLPKLAIVGENHMDGPITIEVPVLNNNFNYWFVGVGVKYNLASLYKAGHKVRRAKSDLTRSREELVLAEEQTENHVQAAYTGLLTSFKDLQTQQKSVELANQNYSVVSNRYDNGLALLTDLLDASNMKQAADLDLVNARTQLLYNYYKVKYSAHSL